MVRSESQLLRERLLTSEAGWFWASSQYCQQMFPNIERRAVVQVRTDDLNAYGQSVRQPAHRDDGSGKKPGPRRRHPRMEIPIRPVRSSHEHNSARERLGMIVGNRSTR